MALLLKTRDLNELNVEVEKLMTKDSLTIPPAGFTGKKDDNVEYTPVNDFLGISLDAFIPTIDDAEIMLVSVIGCVPTVGPILQGVFTIFSGRFKEGPLTKDQVNKMIDEKLDEFKIVMEKVIDSKIDKSDIELYKRQCTNAFNGFKNSSLELLIDDLNILKKRLTSGSVIDKNDSFMIGLRGKFDNYRTNLKALLPQFLDKKFLPFVCHESLELMFLYIFLMRNLMQYWYQYGFDPVYARGTPATKGNDDATHSYREKLHINIQKALRSFMLGLVCNIDGLDNLQLLLECDPILYPIPLVKAPRVPSDNCLNKKTLSEVYKMSVPTTEIDVNQRARPFIYRIDAVNFHGDLVSECRDGGRGIPARCEQITGCQGFYFANYPCNAILKLSESKMVTLRLFVFFDQDIYNFGKSGRYSVTLNGFIDENPVYFTWDKIEYQSGCLNNDSEFFYRLRERKDENGIKNYRNDYISEAGFIQTKKFQTKFMNISMSSTGGSNKLMFLEVVISDN